MVAFLHVLRLKHIGACFVLYCASRIRGSCTSLHVAEWEAVAIRIPFVVGDNHAHVIDIAPSAASWENITAAACIDAGVDNITQCQAEIDLPDSWTRITPISDLLHLEHRYRSSTPVSSLHARKSADLMTSTSSPPVDFVALEALKYGPLCVELTRMARSTGYPLEGSLWQPDYSFDSMTATLQDKINVRKRHFLLSMVESRRPQYVLQTGFNAGHSSAMMLHTMPGDGILVSFDGCWHPYAFPNHQRIQRAYNGRHGLVCGDSRAALPRFRADSGNTQADDLKFDFKFDLVFLDGGHLYDVALADIQNSRVYAVDNALVVLDDCVHPMPEDRSGVESHVALAWRHAIGAGIVEPWPDANHGFGDVGMCIGFYK